MKRQQQRQILRKVAEFAVAKLAPDIPRTARRLAGRGYANAAYRRMNDLSHDLYGDSPNGYMKYQLNSDVIKWIATEGEKAIEQTKHQAQTTEAPSGSSSDVDVQSHDGSTGHSEIAPE